jgi:hypothetical protein
MELKGMVELDTKHGRMKVAIDSITSIYPATDGSKGYYVKADGAITRTTLDIQEIEKRIAEVK